MIITKYEITNNPMSIDVSESKRQWMDETPSGFAYRCLPMTVANGFGWSVINPAKFSVTWNGGQSINDVVIKYYENEFGHHAISHFGSSVITFNLGFMLRTEKNHNIYVKGPANNPKRGITALEGIVETDWLPFTFTMNWKITEPNYEVMFEKGESICNFFPIERGYIEKWKTDIKHIGEVPEESEKYYEWANSRSEYNANLHRNGNKGQRDYLKGTYKNGQKFEQHQNTIKINPFTRKENVVIIDDRPCYDNCCMEQIL